MTPNDPIPAIMEHSQAWVIHTYLTFVISLVAVLGGIFYLDIDFWTRGFLLMGVLFLSGNCFSLAKVVRDQHQAKTWHHRIEAAKTRELLDKYDQAA